MAVDVTELVPGDVVRLAVGDVVPADLRLLDAEGLECDEAVLTGESLPAEKRSDPVQAPESPLDLASCAFMGTVVRTSGDSARPTRLGRRPPQTFCKRLSATPQTSGKRSARRKHTPTMTNPRKPLFQAIFGNQFRPQTSS